MIVDVHERCEIAIDESEEIPTLTPSVVSGPPYYPEISVQRFQDLGAPSGSRNITDWQKSNLRSDFPCNCLIATRSRREVFRFIGVYGDFSLGQTERAPMPAPFLCLLWSCAQTGNLVF